MLETVETAVRPATVLCELEIGGEVVTVSKYRNGTCYVRTHGMSIQVPHAEAALRMLDLVSSIRRGKELPDWAVRIEDYSATELYAGRRDAR